MPINAARYRNASYRLSVHQRRQLPEDTGFEVAFAGRSNAGKSSAINCLCNQTGLAKTSRTPGRTQQIVVFDLDPQRRLMDLPGYGYAKVPADLQRHWQNLLDWYLRQRRALQGIVLVMDARHPLKPFDLQLLSWSNTALMPTHVLLTKSDKLNRQEQINALRTVQAALPDLVPNVEVTVQLFSASKKVGVAELEERLDSWYQWTLPLDSDVAEDHSEI